MKNVIRCAVVETTGSMIDADSIILKAVPRKEKVFTLKDDEGEKRKIEQALEKAGNNLTKAAEILGVSRPTLYKKMEALGLK